MEVAEGFSSCTPMQFAFLFSAPLLLPKKIARPNFFARASSCAVLRTLVKKIFRSCLQFKQRGELKIKNQTFRTDFNIKNPHLSAALSRLLYKISCNMLTFFPMLEMSFLIFSMSSSSIFDKAFAFFVS